MNRNSKVLHLGTALMLTITLATAPASAEESTAEAITKNSGTRVGLCILLGVRDGHLIAQLGKNPNQLVHGLAADTASSKQAREHLHKLGLYGRVSVDQGSFKHLPYADNLANLIVVSSEQSGVSSEEISRVLAPAGVVLVKGALPEHRTLVPGTLTGLRGWTKYVKRRPKDMDEWTHHRHNPDGNAVSVDTVGVPNSLRWQAGPLYQVGRHYYGGGTPVSANGRLFTITCEEEDSPRGPVQKYVLWARDAHNGLLLWKRGASKYCPNLVARANRVYAVLKRNAPLLALDAATGETLKTYDKAVSPDDWLLYKDTLITRKTPAKGAGEVLCLNAETGEERWRKELRAANLLAVDGKVFCLIKQDEKSGELICLDAASGAEKWRTAEVGQLGILFCHYKGTLVFSSSKRRTARVHGVSAKDGKHLWTFKYKLISHGGRPSKVFGIHGLVWVNRDRPDRGWVGLDPQTGDMKKFHREASPRWSRNLCADNRATKRFILTRSMLFVDVETGAYHRPWGMKNACSSGSILPANGLIYTFPHQCMCYPMLRGILGLASEPPVLPGVVHPEGKLEQGPAYGFAGTDDSGTEPWPIYRATGDRSAATTNGVPAEAPSLWEMDFGDRITAPTIAGGKVFIAQTDRHRVLALDMKTGTTAWHYTAGGRISTPPTIYNGLCLFGSNDGWVYCLKAEDGQLVWRFRAAPAKRKIVVLGQMESTWPVHGSVLVHSDYVYFVAGRHSKVDSGIFVYAVHPATGKLRWSKRPKHYHGIGGLLVANGKRGVNFAAQHYSPGSSFFRTGDGRAFGHMEKVFKSLSSNTGLLGELWQGNFSRSRRFSRWHHRGLNAKKMVFDDKTVYGFRMIGSRKETSIVRWDRSSASKGDPSKPVWTIDLPKADRRMPPRHVLAMALTGDVLWVAGRISETPTTGHLLRAYDAKSGKQLREMKLPSSPVNDGIASAGGKLYVSCRDGRLLCFGKQKD